MDRAQAILEFWFGNLADANLPTADRTELWFGTDDKIEQQIQDQFEMDVIKAAHGDYKDYENTPRGRLALIILLDQIPRHLYRDSPKAFEHDQKALRLCLEGITQEVDHALTLIERVFFYMPLEHAEDLEIQKQSIAAYQTLVELSLPELAGIFQGFLNYAVWHYEVIRRFGRFPQRNMILNRESTLPELEFLRQDELKE